jgi:hypothetical protein
MSISYARERCAMALCARDLVADRRLAAAAVDQPGQFVGDRQALERLDLASRRRLATASASARGIWRSISRAIAVAYAAKTSRSSALSRSGRESIRHSAPADLPPVAERQRNDRQTRAPVRRPFRSVLKSG